MKLKLIALATMLAVSGVAQAKIADSNDRGLNIAATSGDMFASLFSESSTASYTVDLGLRLDQFIGAVAPTQLGVKLVWDLNGGVNGTGSFTDGVGSGYISTGLAAQMQPLGYGSVYNTFATPGVLAAADFKFDVKAMDGTPAAFPTAGSNRYLSTSVATSVTATNSQVFAMDNVDGYPVAANLDTTNSTQGTNFETAGANMFDAGDHQNVEFKNGSADNWKGATTFTSPGFVINPLNFFFLTNTSSTAANPASVTKYSGVWEFDATTAQLSYMTAPVPEASTWAMMLAGLGLMGFIGRRRLNSAA